MMLEDGKKHEGPVSASGTRFLIVTQGEYSDYGVLALIEWVSSETPEAVYARYTKDVLPTSPHRYGGKREEGYDEPDVNEWHFLHWLVEQGFAKETPLAEWHIDTYGTPNFEPPTYHKWGKPE